jgi:O-methyltransferase domain
VTTIVDGETPVRPAPPHAQLRQMIFGYVVSQIVGTVARLGLADHLASGPRSGTELAGLTAADPDALGRLLRAAASVGVVAALDGDRFALTAVGEGLRSDGRTLRDLAVAFTGAAYWRPVEQLTDAVLTGAPRAEESLGSSVWDYFKQHPADGASFDAAMGNLSVIDALDVVAHYDVSRFARIVDVGGGRGHLLAGLLGSNPAATGVLFDQSEAAAAGRGVLASRDLADRVEVTAGDFFVEVPSGGDLYVLKAILHDWDDEQSVRILRNCHRAAPPGSTLLVIERVVGEGADPSVHLADLLMLTMLGGRERSRAEFEALLGAGGFRLERITPTPRFGLIEARRV